MKTHEQPIDLEQEATLQYVPDFQDSVFTVVGLGETLLPLAEEIQAAEAAPEPKVSKVSALAIKGTQTASESLTGLYVEPTRRERIAQYFADAHVRKFDKQHDTNLYAELQAKRRKTAVFLKASELHLFDADSDYYKSQLRRMTKTSR